MEKIRQKRGYIRNVSIALALAAVVVACVHPRDDGTAQRFAGGLFLPDSPPSIVREPGAAGVPEPSGSKVEPLGRNGRMIETQATPLLYRTAWGRRYLAATGSRAVAIGEPAARCPGLGVVAGPGRLPDAGQTALARCMGSLEAAGAPDCGCRLIAADDTLLAPLDAFSHAEGVGARLIGLRAGMSRHAGGGPLTARESPEPGPGDSTFVRFDGPQGPVAEASLFDDGRAEMVLSGSGLRLEGRRDLRGWHRGRLTERLLLTDPEGRRVIALIGFEPDDWAREGPALASWPRP